MTINDYNEIFSYPIVKQMTLRFSETGQTDIVLTNSDICSEEMSLEESLCSDENLRFGACESSCFKVRVVNSNTFKGKKLTVSMQIMVDDDRYLVDADGNRIVTDTGDYIVVNFGTKDDSIPLGVYTVYSDELSDDRMWRDLTCYDAMYEVLNTDVAAWYSALTFPMTIKNLRDSFFTHLGITQVTTTLINDSFTTAGGFVAEGELAGKTIIEAICEMNGVFGHINRSGNFEYIGLPSSNSITPKWYIDGTGKYEDYTTDVITGVIARSEASDVGTSVGTDTNLLIIENNPLVYGAEGTQALTTALTNILNNLSSFTFRPFEVKTYGNPCLPIGTGITINTKKYDSVNGYSPFAINSFIKNRVLEGIQALTDSFSTPGKKKRDGTANSIQSQIQRTAGKVHKVQVDLDNFISEIEEADYGTKIAQNAQAIELEASERIEADEDVVIVNDYQIVDVSGVDYVVLKTGGSWIGNRLRSNKRVAVWMNYAIPDQYQNYPKIIVVSSRSEAGVISEFPKIYYNGTIPLTDQFGLGSTMHLIYKENQSFVEDGQTVTLEGFWVGADTSMAKIEIMSGKIVLKVDSNGKIGYQSLRADPDTGLSTFDINTDYISFVANKDFDLSAVNVVIDAENFSLDRRGCVACNDLTVTGGSLSFTGDGTGTEPEYDLKVIDYTNNMVTLAIYSDTINDHNVFDIVITEECLPYFNSNYETSTGTSSCTKWLVIYNAAGTSVIGSGRLLYSNDPSNVDYTNQLGNKVEGDKIPIVLDSYRGYVYSPGPIYSFEVNTDGTMEVDMKYLQITDEGALTCTSGEIGNWEITNTNIYKKIVTHESNPEVWTEIDISPSYIKAESYNEATSGDNAITLYPGRLVGESNGDTMFNFDLNQVGLQMYDVAKIALDGTTMNWGGSYGYFSSLNGTLTYLLRTAEDSIGQGYSSKRFIGVTGMVIPDGNGNGHLNIWIPMKFEKKFTSFSLTKIVCWLSIGLIGGNFTSNYEGYTFYNHCNMLAISFNTSLTSALGWQNYQTTIGFVDMDFTLSL